VAGTDHSGDGGGYGTAEIMRRAGVLKPCVWRWQERFLHEGVAGLRCDKTRKPGLPPLPQAVVDRVIALTLAEPPGEATHYRGRATAAATGVSLRSVQRGLGGSPRAAAPGAAVQAVAGPAFAAKLRDVVGLYLNPPAHSLVLSVDEKSQIQALDRTQQGLPMKKGRAGTMTHDSRQDDAVCGAQCAGRHSDRPVHGASPPQEFIRFLNRIEAAVQPENWSMPSSTTMPRTSIPFARHRRWTFHFTPTSCSWANAVETFFAELTRRRLQRGVFRSLVDLQADQPLPRRTQPQAQTLCLDGRSRPHQ
jgi:hypothetical protein